MLLHRCMCCFAANASELRYDKRGRPYLRCRLCQAKTFMQSLESLRGVAILPQLIESALKLRASDTAYARDFDEKIARMVQNVQSGARPAPGETAVPMAEGIATPFDEAKVGT